MAPPGPAAGSPSPSHSLQAGCRVSLFLAPENAWAPAQGHHVGAPGVATSSRNQPPKTAPRMGPSPAPNWPERHSRPGFSHKPIWRCLRHSLRIGDRLSPNPKTRNGLSSSPQLPGSLTHPSRLRSLLLGGGSSSGSFSRQYGGPTGRQPETDKQLNIQPQEEMRSTPQPSLRRGALLKTPQLQKVRNRDGIKRGGWRETGKNTY